MALCGGMETRVSFVTNTKLYMTSFLPFFQFNIILSNSPPLLTPDTFYILISQ